MSNPEPQRTNPQRAIDEYKKNTPPLIKLGQGREDESSDLDLTPLVLLVSVLSGAALVGIMALAVYAWKFING